MTFDCDWVARIRPSGARTASRDDASPTRTDRSPACEGEGGAGGRLLECGPCRPLLISLLLRRSHVCGSLFAACGAAAPLAARLAACGLPDTKPLWIDYADGAVGFRDQVFGRTGVIAAASGVTVPAALRKEGAQTVYFELKLPSYVGTPSAPVDPAKIDAAVERMYNRATATAACGSPVIVINELFGASTITPWSPTNTVYRADVLQLLEGLQQRGALPVLLDQQPAVHGW